MATEQPGPRMRADLFNAGALHRVALAAYERGVRSGGSSPVGDQDFLVALVFSALAAEAFINEVAGLATDPFFHDSRVSPSIAALAAALAEVESQRGATELKIQIAFIVLTGQALPRDQAPLQDLHLLFSLRNALVHLKLDTRTGNTEEELAANLPKLLEKLRPKGAAVPQPGVGLASWTTLTATPALARWACNTVAAVAQRFMSALPPSDFRDQITRSHGRHLTMIPES